MTKRKPYPTDVSDEEWSSVAPYLVLITNDTPQSQYELREMFTRCAGPVSVLHIQSIATPPRFFSPAL
jgi:hypothetical protein